MSTAHDLRAKKRLEAFNDSLPSRYRSFNIDRAPNRKLCEDLIRRWWNVADPVLDEDAWLGLEDNLGLLLFGAPRTGKTFLASELARRSITNPANDADATFIAMVGWSFECSQRAKECEMGEWTHEIASRIWHLEQSVIVLDDLDKVRATDTVQSAVFDLLETLTANEVTLIVTTNCTATELVKRFDPALGRAIAARLREFCIPVNFDVAMPEGQP